MKKYIVITCLLAIILAFLPSCTSADNTLTGIRVDAETTQKEYSEGASFNQAGLHVYALYSDGSEYEIQTYSVSPLVLSKTDTEVLISYKAYTVTIPVTVKEQFPDESEESQQESDDQNESPEPSAEAESLELVHGPIKTIYAAGEHFDPTGILLSVTAEGKQFEVCQCSYDEEGLQPGQETAEVSYGGKSVSIPITVLADSGYAFHSNVTKDEYLRCIQDITPETESIPNHDFDIYPVSIALPNPCPDGLIPSESALTDYLDYHFFYHISSVLFKPSFDIAEFEDVLNRYYFNSGLAASQAAMQYHRLSNGWYQVVFQFYTDSWRRVKDDQTVLPEILGVPRKSSTRSTDYHFKAVNEETGLTVYTSEQVSYALCNGYTIHPVPGSPADIIVNRAKEILVSVCDDSMTPFEKMHAINLYFMENVSYDETGEELASYVPDIEYEPDQLAAIFTSFHAEGALLYGSSVCYGYAKANAILLGLEGLDVTRVVAKDQQTEGRCPFIYLEETKSFDKVFSIHSYNYVRIDGNYYLSDITYAYAGRILFNGNDKVAWYRDMAMAISEADHRNIYTEYLHDKISGSASYSQNSFFYQHEFTYDGINSIELKNEADIKKYLTFINSKCEQAEKPYAAFTALVSAAIGSYDYINTVMHSTTYSAISHATYGCSQRSINGNDYYLFLFVCPSGK